jgi:hypothetical protein
MRRARQGILPVRMEPGPTDQVTGHAGLTLIIEAMRAFGINKLADKHLKLRERDRGFSENASLEAVVAMLAAGGDCIEDIKVLQADAGLVRMLGDRLPSPDALHRFFARFDQSDEGGAVGKRGEAILRPDGEALTGLRHLCEALVSRACAGERKATIDVDATIIESHNRAALPHYQGGRGYQPVLALWAEQDLVVADEFRDGNVPAGMDPLVCTKRAFESLPASVGERYMRGDTACYEEHLLKYLCEKKVLFAIGADMTRELRAVCTRRRKWDSFEDRPRASVDISEVSFFPGVWSKKSMPLRYVALRFTAKQGELFGDGSQVMYLAIVSNRWDIEPAELARWYWQKAGTVEQAHDVMKNELGAGTMPSSLFGANAAWYRINGLAYNILSLLRRRALPERLSRAYPKRLRFEFFNVGARLIDHAGELTARLNIPTETTQEIIAARGRLLEIFESGSASN